MSGPIRRATWESEPEHVKLLLQELLADPQVTAETVRRSHHIIDDRYSTAQVNSKLICLRKEYRSPEDIEARLVEVNEMCSKAKTKAKMATGYGGLKIDGAVKLRKKLEDAQVSQAKKRTTKAAPPRSTESSQDLDIGAGESDDDEFEEMAIKRASKRPFTSFDERGMTSPAPIFIATVSSSNASSSPTTRTTTTTATTATTAAPTTATISSPMSSPPMTHTELKTAALPITAWPFRTGWLNSFGYSILYVLDLPAKCEVRVSMERGSGTYFLLQVDAPNPVSTKGALRQLLSLPSITADVGVRYWKTSINKPAGTLSGVIPEKLPNLEEGIFALRFPSAIVTEPVDAVVEI